MRPVHVIVLEPFLNRNPRLPDISEPVFIQTFIPEFTIVAFNQRVLSRFPLVDEMDIYMVSISPFKKCPEVNSAHYQLRSDEQYPRALNPVPTNEPAVFQR
jgi:hypothetical protein